MPKKKRKENLACVYMFRKKSDSDEVNMYVIGSLLIVCQKKVKFSKIIMSGEKGKYGN